MTAVKVDLRALCLALSRDKRYEMQPVKFSVKCLTALLVLYNIPLRSQWWSAEFHITEFAHGVVSWLREDNINSFRNRLGLSLDFIVKSMTSLLHWRPAMHDDSIISRDAAKNRLEIIWEQVKINSSHLTGTMTDAPCADAAPLKRPQGLVNTVCGKGANGNQQEMCNCAITWRSN